MHLKHRMRGVWRDAEFVDPNTHNNKLAIYHYCLPSLFPVMSKCRHLDLSKHVMHNVSKGKGKGYTAVSASEGS